MDSDSDNNNSKQDNIYTVVELNNYIKDIIVGTLSDTIKVTGEISNIKTSNGNMYATLKSEESSISIMMWKYKKTEIKNGDKVIVEGKLSCYLKFGTYNISVSNIQHVGVGEIHKIYEELKNKCEKLGYFSKDLKKPAPMSINKIGIVTALGGAAIQDILYVLKKNNFLGTVVIKGCLVQGNSCPQSVAKSIKELSEWKDSKNNKLDVILITRGGGSFEDLMGFSDIKVIEAINKSKIFTISAVGHEIDFMLSDFAADIRTPTPSVAAEYICSNQSNISNKLEKCRTFFENHIKTVIENKIMHYQTVINSLSYKLKDPTSDLDKNIKYLNDLRDYFNNKIINVSDKYLNKLNNLQSNIDNHNIDKILESGYSLVLNRGKICDSIKSIKKDQKLKIKFKDGEATVIVNSI